MIFTKASTITLGARGFDDELAASLFKLALVEAYCRGEIEADAVQTIFNEVAALRAA